MPTPDGAGSDVRTRRTRLAHAAGARPTRSFNAEAAFAQLRSEDNPCPLSGQDTAEPGARRGGRNQGGQRHGSPFATAYCCQTYRQGMTAAMMTTTEQLMMISLIA